MQNWHIIFGDTYTLSLGPDFGVFLKNPQDVEIILNNTRYIEKSREYSYVEAWLGTGLLTSTGSKWSTRRKLITPTFHFNILKQFIPIIGDHTRVLIDKFDRVSDGEVVDIMPYISAYTLDVICGKGEIRVVKKRNDKLVIFYFNQKLRWESTLIRRKIQIFHMLRQ
jgi:cytochrome P450 family 4